MSGWFVKIIGSRPMVAIHFRGVSATLHRRRRRPSMAAPSSPEARTRLLGGPPPLTDHLPRTVAAAAEFLPRLTSLGGGLLRSRGSEKTVAGCVGQPLPPAIDVERLPWNPMLLYHTAASHASPWTWCCASSERDPGKEPSC